MRESNFNDGLSLLEQKMTNAPLSGKKPQMRRTDTQLRKALKKLHEENKKLKALINKKNSKCRFYQQKIRRLEAKLSTLHEAAQLKKSLKDLHPCVKTLVYMQIRHIPNSPWSIAEKKISISMFYKSAALYNFLLRKIHLNLPSISTLRTWIRVIDLKTGFNTTFLKKLRTRVDIMSNLEKQCVLLMDEISLKKSVEYDERLDVFEGFQDFAEEGGRSTKEASHAIVFMARGLYHNWSVPLAYYLSSGSVIAKQLKICLERCFVEIEKLGLNINALVCDQGSNNRSVYSMFGVSHEKPYIIFNEKKIFALYDPPHLIKNVRNALMKRDILIGGENVSWRDIKETHEIDARNSLSRTLLKITENHVNPNAFQKMKVKLATQIFSRTFYSTMMTVIATGELRSKSATSTAKFVLKMNDLFDCLNSQGNFEVQYLRRPLSEKNTTAIQTLKESINYIKSWNVEKNIPYCFNGLKQTINGLLLLWDETKESNPYLITSRLNQDPIENLFSKIRQRRGYDPNPSARYFRFGLQSVMTGCLEKYTDSSNCEDDNDVYISVMERSDCAEVKPSDMVDREDMITSSVDSDNNSELYEEDFIEHRSTLESNSVAYFAGYLMKKFSSQYKCENCEKEFLSESIDKLGDDGTYISIKNYNDGKIHLRIPSTDFCQLIRKALSIIEKKILKKPEKLQI